MDPKFSTEEFITQLDNISFNPLRRFKEGKVCIPLRYKGYYVRLQCPPIKIDKIYEHTNTNTDSLVYSMTCILNPELEEAIQAMDNKLLENKELIFEYCGMESDFFVKSVRNEKEHNTLKLRLQYNGDKVNLTVYNRAFDSYMNINRNNFRQIFRKGVTIVPEIYIRPIYVNRDRYGVTWCVDKLDIIQNEPNYLWRAPPPMAEIKEDEEELNDVLEFI